MSQPLFFEPDVSFEKTAGMVDLPEDPNAWPKEVLDELYKQVPYIADFKPHVVMAKVDEERAYGFGHVKVSNQSQAQQGTPPEGLQAAGIRTVRIPVIIKEGKLMPFDLLVTDSSKVLPLTEGRLRQAIFRPQMFDVTSQTPGDQGMIGQLYPPYRQNYGFGGGGVSVPASGMGKMGSVFEEELFEMLESLDGGHRKPKEKTAGPLSRTPAEVKGRAAQEAKAKNGLVPISSAKRLKVDRWLDKQSSILEHIAPTISKGDLNYFWEKVSSDLGIQAQMKKNAHAVTEPMRHLVDPPILDQEKRASVVSSLVRPDVSQYIHTGDGYTVKTASSKYWQPKQEHIHRGELVERVGEKVAMAIDRYGSVVIADGCVAKEKWAMAEDVEPVRSSGLYKVVQEDGTEAVGYVIPNLLDLDGESLPIALFTNGTTATIQSEIQGKQLGQSFDLPDGPPDGFGSFYTAGDEGEVIATIPMTITSSYEMEGEPGTFIGETYDGRPVELSLQPNIKEITPVGEGRVLIPNWWKWMPLGKADTTALAGGETESLEQSLEEEAKEASLGWVTIRGNISGTFDFDGPAVEKLSYDQTRSLDVDGAMFLLAGLGTEQGYGTTKLAHAMKGDQPVKVKIGRLLRTAGDVVAMSTKVASMRLRTMPFLKKDLIKEASTLPDPMAVDVVLSLGFINPENTTAFVSFLPRIEDAQSKMCELLLASRVGLQDVPTTALERSIRGVEEVLEGLKTIAFQG